VRGAGEGEAGIVMAMDSGLGWGNDGGMGEHKLIILENSRLYHSESDSESESEDWSSEDKGERGAARSCMFLNGRRRVADIGESESERGEELSFVITRGFMDARRGLKDGRDDE
jgi:hypothetical protein